ncbi:MAG: enoyl-[acyl-carrier-protein] reductase [Parachlamydiales bacterium]
MLKIDLKGKKAFIAGIGDDQGFGWAIAKALATAGCQILVGTWTPILGIFTKAYEMGKFDESRKLPDGSLMEIAQVYSLDATFDTPEDVPQEIRENKRYQGASGYTISEVAEKIGRDHGKIDILIHSLANGPEVKNPLLETSRKGYLAAVSSSAYSYVSLLRYLGPHMNRGGASLTLTYMASERTIPGYGGGMSSAKAALESDTRTIAYEAGRKWGLRANAISAGPLPSRAAKAIGMIERMVTYVKANSPIQQELSADEVGAVAAFLCSPLGVAINGETIHVDHGYHSMGMATE